MMNPSAAYLQALEEAKLHHASSKTYSGKFLRPHAPFIKALIDQHHARSVLDYGCGKGVQYEWVSHGDDASIPGGQTIEQFWGLPVVKYDPAWPMFSRDPEERVGFGQRFDIVLLTHVLGSIPIGDLNGWVMPRLLKLTGKALYIAEKLGPVNKQVFSDANNLPRWPGNMWRVWASNWSLRASATPIVLSLRSRDTETTVERFIYQNGREAPWRPSLSKTLTAS